jgi:hypothetical protein
VAVIDQTRTWRKVEERLETETDPVLRRNLELLLKHMKAETVLDLPALMSTVSENSVYQNFAQDPSTWPRGKAGVQAFYENFAASGAHKLCLDLDRLVVDRHCILTEGQMLMAWPGRTLQAMGIEVDDPDADYLYDARMAIIWPIDEDGLFIGEDSYVGRDGFEGIAERKLRPEDIIMYEPLAASS